MLTLLKEVDIKMPRKLIFAVIAIVLSLLALEAVARLVEFKTGRNALSFEPSEGWQTAFFSRFFDWHEPDPELLWRFRANLQNPLIKTNSSHLLGDEFPIKKTRNQFRILLLGDSSPVGLGLISRKQAFGELLRHFLQLNLAGKAEIELVNAAVSGYSSEQIVHLLRNKGWSYHPDAVILYCGNNDASISGEYSDRELLQKQKLISLRKLLQGSALYRFLQSLFFHREKENVAPAQPLKPRVSSDEFEENLRLIKTECRQKLIPLIILKPPVPHLWPAGLQFRVFTHLTGRTGETIIPQPLAAILGQNISYCLDSNLFHHLYGDGDIFTRAVFQSAFTENLPAAAVKKMYEDSLRQEQNNPLLWNNLGVAFWRNREFIQAEHCLITARQLYAHENSAADNFLRLSGGSPILYNIGINHLSQSSLEALADSASLPFIYLDSALQADYFSLRIKQEYLDVIDRLDTVGVMILDLPALFHSRGGEKLFIDHCHPTAEGHRLIAELLTDKILASGIIKASP